MAHLRTLIESSRDDGPNFELYADELERKFGFKRDRTTVRRFCPRAVEIGGCAKGRK